MKYWRNYLDERQEQKLKEIESHGCWLAIWSLFIAIFVKLIIYGWNFTYSAAEGLIIIVVSLYISISCIRNGIWDRHLKTNIKTNLVGAFLAGIVLTIVNYMMFYGKYPENAEKAISIAILIGVIGFVVVFLFITFIASLSKKKLTQLEADPEEDEQ